MLFHKGPLFFSEIPYESVIDLLANKGIVTKTLEETYHHALYLINHHDIDLSKPIMDWIEAYYATDTEILNPFSKGYLHIYGYDSYNTSIIPKHDQVLIRKIRENLGITFDLPDELVLIAILNEYDNDIGLKDVLRNYGNHDNKSLAHIGDRVIELIMINMVMKMNNTCYDDLYKNITDLISNKTFRCLMDHKYLCEYITKGKYHNKACPDLFEAIIGAIYYWYSIILKDANTLKIIETWLIDTFNFDIIVKDWFNQGIKPCDTKQQYALTTPTQYFTKIYKEVTLPSTLNYKIIVLTEFFGLNDLNIELDYMLFELLLLATSNKEKYYDIPKKTSIIGCVTKSVLMVLGRNVFKMLNAHLYYELMLSIQPLNYIYPNVDRSKATKFHELFISTDAINCYLGTFDNINDYLGVFKEQPNNFIQILGAFYYWAYFIHHIDPINLVRKFMNVNLNYTEKIYHYIITDKQPCDYDDLITKDINDLKKYLDVISFDQIQLSDATLKYENKYNIWTPHKILTIITDKEYLVEVNKKSTLDILYSPDLTQRIVVNKLAISSHKKTINQPKTINQTKTINQQPINQSKIAYTDELENIIMNLDTSDFSTIGSIPAFNALLNNPNYWEKLYKKYFFSGIYKKNMSHESLFKLNFSLRLLIKKLDLKFSSLLKLYDVIELLLHDKNLTTLPKEIGILTNLRHLDISYNQLTTLPSEIGNLSNLVLLKAKDNLLTSLPKEIGNLVNLRKLDLSYNELTSLPDEIGNLIKLEELQINDNPLLVLPQSINQLKKLKIG